MSQRGWCWTFMQQTCVHFRLAWQWVAWGGASSQNYSHFTHLHPFLQTSLPVTAGTDASPYLTNIYIYNIYNSWISKCILFYIGCNYNFTSSVGHLKEVAAKLLLLLEAQPWQHYSEMCHDRFESSQQCGSICFHSRRSNATSVSILQESHGIQRVPLSTSHAVL